MSDTEGSLTDDGKRKREDEFHKVLSKKSKKAHKTSPKQQAKKEASKVDMAGIEENTKLLNQLIGIVEQIRKDQTTYISEIKQLKEENRKMITRIELLETRLMRVDIQQYSNQGRRYPERSTKTEFLQSTIQVQAKIIEATKIKTTLGKDIIVAKLGSWEDKQNIMQAKSKLKGTKVFIDNDLTKEENRVQANLRKLAKNERDQGKNVNVGYQKLIVDKQIWDWDGKTEKIIERNTKT
ncbi:hypothetical protein Zmor_015710 [Zophobas morio]|uniref:Uncharacterized protein n=1 Tax=Zophobas morio TaxID=2755281 RepID=A0AA38IEZ4_9CUCU|nr:hypothetical protein Zmor_015710 [Zophobas morio]